MHTAAHRNGIRRDRCTCIPSQRCLHSSSNISRLCSLTAGAALSMLLADMLGRVDVVRIISGFLKTYLKGNPALPMILQLVDGIVKQNEAAAKRKLYALALGSVFTIELGPLLTALLLAGRVGGSHAGGVAMMASTHQASLAPASLPPPKTTFQNLLLFVADRSSQGVGRWTYRLDFLPFFVSLSIEIGKGSLTRHDIFPVRSVELLQRSLLQFSLRSARQSPFVLERLSEGQEVLI
ncbi:MAG: hypothetical protein SGPRY_006551 [Prymnesium sp.]